MIPSSRAHEPRLCSLKSEQQNFPLLYIDQLPVIFLQQKSSPSIPFPVFKQFSAEKFEFKRSSCPLFWFLIVRNVCESCLSHSQIARSCPEDSRKASGIEILIEILKTYGILPELALNIFAFHFLQ